VKAICVVRETELEVQEIPQPAAAADNHVLIKMEACAINHGDKYFLANPAARAALAKGKYDVWGASGAGKVIQVGKNVPENYLGKNVAIYRSLVRTPETFGLWSEVAQVTHLNCVVLPDTAKVEDYSGSLVNVITAYSFIEQIIEEGHQGIIASAGNSATGRALFSLAQRRNLPVISLVRNAHQKNDLEKLGQKNVLDLSETGFDEQLRELAQKLQTTAVFEGVGGELISRIAPLLPFKSCLYFYGFLTGADSFSIQSRLMMEKMMAMRPFSNFLTKTVTDKERLQAALNELGEVFDQSAFRTHIGRRFSFDQIGEAMKFSGEHGSKSLLEL
jgi:NADPH2:quinone reductase